MRNVWYEAFIVGILVAVLGVLFSKLMTKGSHPRMDSPYLITMILTLILTGMAVHLFFEWSGTNEKFCRTLLGEPYGRVSIRS